MSTLKISVSQGIVEIETILPKTISKSKDMWTLKASQLIWVIWSRMGWTTTCDNFISIEDWYKPLDHSNNSHIMAKIERLIKLSAEDLLQDDVSFESAISAIAETAKAIENEDVLILSCPEIEKFRHMVVKLMFIGLLRGLDVKSAVEMELLLDPIYAVFFDKEYTPLDGSFVFYETKLSLVGVYSVESTNDISFSPVHIQLKSLE